MSEIVLGNPRGLVDGSEGSFGLATDNSSYAAVPADGLYQGQVITAVRFRIRFLDLAQYTAPENTFLMSVDFRHGSISSFIQRSGSISHPRIDWASHPNNNEEPGPLEMSQVVPNTNGKFNGKVIWVNIFVGSEMIGTGVGKLKYVCELELLGEA